ncbi:hypothetical protein OBV_37440 [Oscillibacter valericigenes Sjm18-20]|nr:hypothetical protein OBV_37440 [Oscillibacter valericigenes Sjm18-20]
MVLRKPDYFGHFHCLAGACPHSCCEGWEVVVDGPTADYYRSLPGPLGDRLRTALQTGDGEDYFALTDTLRCPFWDTDGLCAIHRLLGPECTSEVCRSHPRFIEDYGSVRETSLCASCPEACRLLLASSTPLTFPLTQTDEEGEPADPWLLPLLAVRAKSLEILEDRSCRLYSRFAELLVFTNAAQSLLDEEAADRLPDLCSTWTTPAVCTPPAGDGLFPHGWEVLSGLEILGSDWRTLLLRGKEAVPGTVPAPLLERIAAYFLFRYELKAINDGDLLGRMQFVLFSALTVERAASLLPLPEALRLYCREIEHDAENLDALLWAFRSDPVLSAFSFFQTLEI